MSTIVSFFEEKFFINGTEGIILFAMCVAAVVLMITAIALVITVIVTIKHRRRETVTGASEPVQKTATAEQAEQADVAETHFELPAETPVEVLAETHSEASATVSAERGVRLNKSFTAKLIQSSDEVKAWYADLRNELLSYKKVKSCKSWKRESYHFGRKNVVRFAFRGKTLCAYFALDPNGFEGSKYKVETVEAASYADTPCMYRIKNGRRVRYAAELIDTVMKDIGAARNEKYVPEDHYLPYENDAALIEKCLIKCKNSAAARRGSNMT